MKSKIKLIIFSIKILIFLTCNSFSNVAFNFNITEMEIKDNGKRILGKNKGVAKSIDGTTIEANNFDYDKVENILISSGTVKIYDPNNNIIILSDKMTYYKNKELIITEGNSKIIDSNIEIDADNFKYNKFKDTIYATGNVEIENKKEKYLILSDKITYYKNKELIITEGNSKIIDSNIEIDADNFKYNKFKDTIYATGNVEIENKKEKYLISSDTAKYDRNLKKIVTKKLKSFNRRIKH